jgi:hypothetical protein
LRDFGGGAFEDAGNAGGFKFRPGIAHPERRAQQHAGGADVAAVLHEVAAMAIVGAVMIGFEERFT